MQGVEDPGTRQIFKFRSGTNRLKEEPGEKKTIGRASYVGKNVRVWYMCSGNVLCMIPLERLSWDK